MLTVAKIGLLLLISAVYVCSAQSSVQWAGYQWFLRDQQNSGPGKYEVHLLTTERSFYLRSIQGPNNWTSDNIWIDSSQNLHLKLAYSNATGGWASAELYSCIQFGYGTYRWFVEGALDNLDANVVFGLFTYGGQDGTNEIDIETAKWGQTDPQASNYFYTVYPRALGPVKSVSSGTRLSLQGTYTTHTFIWSSQNVALQIQGGFLNATQTDNVIFSYQTPANFTPIIPYLAAPIHMNLWAFEGKLPINGQEVEIIIHDFEYIQADLTSTGD